MDYLNAADNGYQFLLDNFYDSDQYGFHTTQNEAVAVYTPKVVAALSGALREARLVGGNMEATQIYVNFWNTVTNSMQLAEGDASGEIGNDSDGDGIPFIAEQSEGLAPVFASEATQNLSGTTDVHLGKTTERFHIIIRSNKTIPIRSIRPLTSVSSCRRMAK